MDTPKIRFGSSKVTEPIDESTNLVTTTTYFDGKPFVTNEVVIRNKIPTSRPTIDELQGLINDLFYHPDKFNPSVAVESKVNDKGTTYYLVTRYTVMNVR